MTTFIFFMLILVLPQLITNNFSKSCSQSYIGYAWNKIVHHLKGLLTKKINNNNNKWWYFDTKWCLGFGSYSWVSNVVWLWTTIFYLFVDASSNNGNEGRFNLSTWWQAIIATCFLVKEAWVGSFSMLVCGRWMGGWKVRIKRRQVKCEAKVLAQCNFFPFSFC